MLNPYVLKQLAKAKQRDLFKEAALCRRTQSSKIAGPEPKKYFIEAGDTILKKIVMRGKQERLPPEERLILNNSA